MDNLDWNEVVDSDEIVDSYVDGELSDDESRWVEARAETDLEFRERIEWALELRERLTSLKTTVPEGFSERLLNAINGSSVWDAIALDSDEPLAAETVRRVERSSSRRRIAPVAVAVCAVVVVAGLSFEGFNRLRRPSPDVDTNPVAATNKPSEGLEPSSPVTLEPRALIMTPSPAGNAPESVVNKRSPNGFWCTASFTDEQLKMRVREFQTLCGKQESLKLKKVKSDLEFELTNVKPGTWRVVAGWIEQTADAYEYSDALRSWSAKEDGQAKAKSLRVSFGPFDQSIGTEELEQTEQ